MKHIEENKFLNNLANEFKIKIPNKFSDLSIYKEIKKFKDAEYIYCIAYEMLIRTDEYNKLLQSYKSLRNKSKYDMTDDEFSKIRQLIYKMNKLGLKKTSFLGFDCENDNDHVFKRIEYYDEVINSPWNVRMVHKFQIDQSLGFNSIYHMLIDFYNKKNELHVFENGEYKNILLPTLDTDEVNQTNCINNIHITEIYIIIDNLFIPYNNDTLKYKALKDIVYLKELDEDFLSLVREKKHNDLLMPIEQEFSHSNVGFWYKYSINDIKDGLSRLIDFYIEENLIYNSCAELIKASKTEILENPTNFYIRCVNRMEENEIKYWNKAYDPLPDNSFREQLKFDGHKFMIADEGFFELKQEENIYLISLNEHISLLYLQNSFLKTLRYEDLKNKYIDTEPIFSRPRLMFDEARLTNIPVNLNLSKEDLLLYISQIKDNYDRDKNIVKSDKEYFFDLTLESDLIQIPKHFKSANEKRTKEDKDKFKIKRHEFTEQFASAFYAYDLFKFFVRLFRIKRKSIRRKRRLEIKKIKEIAKKEGNIISKIEITEAKERAAKEIDSYKNNNLITQISYLLNDLSEEKVEDYLTTMKELIHGVNKKGENCILKKKYNPEKIEDTKPKYKNLIIGDSYFIKSNKPDLLRSLGI